MKENNKKIYKKLYAKNLPNINAGKQLLLHRTFTASAKSNNEAQAYIYNDKTNIYKEFCCPLVKIASIISK